MAKKTVDSRGASTPFRTIGDALPVEVRQRLQALAGRAALVKARSKRRRPKKGSPPTV